jgi:hypothetical protein
MGTPVLEARKQTHRESSDRQIYRIDSNSPDSSHPYEIEIE